MNDNKADRIPDYIRHIIAAIDRIELYTSGLSHDEFVLNDMAQVAVIRQFEILGEAARRILIAAPNFTARYPAMELENAYRMRNALAHGYESVNATIVWDTFVERLPPLKLEARRVLREL